MNNYERYKHSSFTLSWRTCDALMIGRLTVAAKLPGVDFNYLTTAMGGRRPVALGGDLPTAVWSCLNFADSASVGRTYKVHESCGAWYKIGADSTCVKKERKLHAV